MWEQRLRCRAAKIRVARFSDSAALVPKNPLCGFTFAGSRLLTRSTLVSTAVEAILLSYQKYITSKPEDFLQT